MASLAGVGPKQSCGALRACVPRWMSLAMMEEATGRLYINEINTIPGFTSISMFPKMWEYGGLSFARLVERLIELGLERHAAKKATRFTR